MLPPKFRVNWPFGSGEEAKNRFPVGTILAIFFIYKSSQCFLPSFKSLGLSVQEKKRKIDFQDGGHSGFPIETILVIFDHQVTPMIPTKFRVNWPRGVGGVGF